jgi:hypothetical protein
VPVRARRGSFSKKGYTTVAIFDVGSAVYQGPTAVGGTAVLVWTGTTSALNAISPAQTLRDITVINTGANPVSIGGSLAAFGTAMTIPPGAQLTVQGWTTTTGTSTHDVYAVAASGAATSTVVASLASNAWVV